MQCASSLWRNMPSSWTGVKRAEVQPLADPLDHHHDQFLNLHRIVALGSPHPYRISVRHVSGSGRTLELHASTSKCRISRFFLSRAIYLGDPAVYVFVPLGTCFWCGPYNERSSCTLCQMGASLHVTPCALCAGGRCRGAPPVGPNSLTAAQVGGQAWNG